MVRPVIIIVIVVLVISSLSFVLVRSREVSTEQTTVSVIKNSMKLTNNAFAHNEMIPLVYTCDGENINPPLLIDGIPAGTKELVLIVDDPDSPSGTWTHWTMWSIAPDTKEILEGSVPSGAQQGLTSFGTIGYGGPCPQSGTHRYSFRVYALDEQIVLPNGATFEELEEALGTRVIDRAEIIGRYRRTS